MSDSQSQSDRRTRVGQAVTHSVSALSKTLTTFTENNAVYESRSISATDKAVSNVSLVQIVFYYYEISNDISAKRHSKTGKRKENSRSADSPCASVTQYITRLWWHFNMQLDNSDQSSQY